MSTTRATSSQPLKRVVIYTDGACRQGSGGWAAILQFGDREREIFGHNPDTTNNRMELRAAIEALMCLKSRCQVDLFTDSEYVLKGITQWIRGWKRRGWVSQTGEPVKNYDLWICLDVAASQHLVHWHWVRGHSGDVMNERCDALAVKASRMKPEPRPARHTLMLQGGELLAPDSDEQLSACLG